MSTVSKDMHSQTAEWMVSSMRKVHHQNKNTCPDLWKGKKTCPNGVSGIIFTKLNLMGTLMSGETVPYINAWVEKPTALLPCQC